MNRPPTVEQLLVLADRAEFKGGLSQPEADRLRAGIRRLAAERAAADAARASAADRADCMALRDRRAMRQLAAVRALVRAMRRRGAQSVSLRVLAAAVDTAPDAKAAAA